MDMDVVKELLIQALEHEKGGIQVYDAALKCALNEELKEEWQKYREETERHVQVLHDLMVQMQLDPEEETPGRKIVRDLGESLVRAIEAARGAGEPESAECIACECVVLAETSDHSNWELIGEVARAARGAEGKALKDAYNEVEEQEDEHLYHSKGWLRELSLKTLGLEAVLPPPEERQDVHSAMGAARAKAERTKMR